MNLDPQTVNFEHIRRKRAYQTGTNIEIKQEYTDETKKVLKDFTDVPDILPIQPKAAAEGEERKEEDGLYADLQGFNYDDATEEEKKAFLNKF